MRTATFTLNNDFGSAALKVLITGAGGQLGHDVIKELNARQIDCLGVDMADFDICNAEAVNGFVEDYHPDAVIHCAAYTAVDKAQEQPEKCYRINVVGTRNIASACGRIGAKMIYISTDYVFGADGESFLETNAPKRPLNVYGETKLAGEVEALRCCPKCFVVRTSWVFGKNGGNFVRTMLRLAAQRDSINVVCDQVGSPTYTVDLAKLLCDMVITEKYGVYHATNEGVCSWAEFALCIMKLKKSATVIHPVSTKEYGAAADRPLNSRLSKKSLDDAGFSRLPDYEDALMRYLVETEEI